MEPRKKSVEAGITYSEVSVAEKVGPGPVRIIEYCPGNGTRYVLSIVDLSGFSDDALEKMGRSGHCFLVAHINGGAGRAMTVGGNDVLHYRYVAEKLSMGIPDAVVVAEVIAYFCKLQAVSSEEYATGNG